MDGDAAPTSSHRIRAGAEPALHPYRAQQPRDRRCCFPAASDLNRLADPEHLLGPGQRVGSRQGAGALGRARGEDSQRQPGASGRRNDGADRDRSREKRTGCAQQDLIIAQSTLQLQQLLMKNAIARNVTNDLLDHAEVVPTDIMQVPLEEPVVPIQDLVADALAHRPELAQARIDLTNRQITKSSARNALLPTVDLFGSYSGAGLAGQRNALCQTGQQCGGGGGLGNGGGTGEPPFLGGFGDAFDAAFGKDFPSYAVGLNVTIPIRNRAAQADQTRSELEFRQAQARLQQLENQVRIEVRNAQFSAQQDRARVEAAQAGRDLAQQTLEAEQQKYQVGASTNFLVLQAQRDMVQAESNLVTAMTVYEKSHVELDRVVGLTLTRNGIVMDDAERGQVSHEPAVPGVQSRQEKP